MPPVLRAGYALSALALVLAWAVARRRPEHRPVALLLAVGLVADVVRRILTAKVILPAAVRFGPAPFEGWARVAGHVDEALFLAWPSALAAAALVTFDATPHEDGRRRHRRARVLLAVGVVWAGAVVALVAPYPVTRGPVLARCYLVAELAALVAGVGTIAARVANDWIPKRGAPEPQHVAIALVVADELASALAGPWRFDLFGSWVLAQVSHALLLAVLVALQGGFLWMLSSSSR